jgi:hypothetical protein
MIIRAECVIGIELALDPAHMEASCRACGRSRREEGGIKECYLHRDLGYSVQ